MAARIIEVEEGSTLSHPTHSGLRDLAEYEQPSKGKRCQRPFVADDLKVNASKDPVPDLTDPEKLVDEEANLSFVHHVSDVHAFNTSISSSASCSRQVPNFSASNIYAACPVPWTKSTLAVPLQASNMPGSPYGVLEHQRVKNAVVGPDEVGGTRLTMFLDPEPGQTEWRAIKIFVPVISLCGSF